MKVRWHEMPPLRWPGTASPTPDFLRPCRTVHPLSWLLLVLGCTAAALAAYDGLQAWRQRQAAEQQLASAQTRLDRPRPVAKAAVGARPPSRDDPGVRIAYPWLAVFQAVEAASVPDVRWLGMEHAIDGPLRLEGETTNSDAAWQATEALRQIPGWRDAGLSRIERAESANGALRFDLTARRAGTTTAVAR